MLGLGIGLNVRRGAGGDAIAPTLSSPVDTATGTTTGSGSVTTDEDNGTLYWVVTTSSTGPSAAQVKAGQDHTGSAAVDSGSQAVSSAGAQAISGGFAGLTAGTEYFAHYMHEDDATNQSDVSSGDGFTTDAEPVTVFDEALNTDSGGTANFSLRQLIANSKLGGSGVYPQVRVTLRASDGEGCNVDNVGIGIYAGTGDTDTEEVPVEVLFSGGSGVAIGAGETAVSDWTDLAIDLDADGLVVISDIGSSAAADQVRYRTAITGTTAELVGSSDTYDQTSASGTVLASRTYLVQKVEVR